MNKLLENSLLEKFKERHQHFTIKTDDDVEKLEVLESKYPTK
jgi:hypothetical protein